MSAPPETIHVKRKRVGEEGSVDFLRVEPINKRRRSFFDDQQHWVYQRKDPGSKSAEETTPHPRRDVRPVIRISQPGDENRPLNPLRETSTEAPSAVKAEEDKVLNVSASDPAPPSAALGGRRTNETPQPSVRRFHLSRSNAPQPAGGVSRAGIKKRSAPALFVERSRKKRVSDVSQLLARSESGLQNAAEDLGDELGTADVGREAESEGQPQPSVRQNKRPGAASRTTTSSTKPTLPDSLLNRQGVDMDQLARDMDAYTLSHISHTLQEQKERDEKAAKAQAMAAQRTKFRPKAPVQRFAERNPDFMAQFVKEKGQSDDMVGVEQDASDEEDYVLETYVRVPASRLTDKVLPHKVGLLVFDTEPDMEFFYGEDDDSDDMGLEDDEDENAENYYGADYPDEDLPWDDEFDRNPYQYRTGNASDLENFDERDFNEEALVDAAWDDTAKRTREDNVLQSLGRYALQVDPDED